MYDPRNNERNNQNGNNNKNQGYFNQMKSYFLGGNQNGSMNV